MDTNLKEKKRLQFDFSVIKNGDKFFYIYFPFKH